MYTFIVPKKLQTIDGVKYFKYIPPGLDEANAFAVKVPADVEEGEAITFSGIDVDTGATPPSPPPPPLPSPPPSPSPPHRAPAVEKADEGEGGQDAAAAVATGSAAAENVTDGKSDMDGYLAKLKKTAQDLLNNINHPDPSQTPEKLLKKAQALRAAVLNLRKEKGGKVPIPASIMTKLATLKNLTSATPNLRDRIKQTITEVFNKLTRKTPNEGSGAAASPTPSAPTGGSRVDRRDQRYLRNKRARSRRNKKSSRIKSKKRSRRRR